VKAITVKFGEGSKGGVDGHKIRFYLGAWFSYDEQKNRREGPFFSLGRTGTEIISREAKGPFVESKCLVIQRDFQREVSDSKSSSGIGVEARQPESHLQALL